MSWTQFEELYQKALLPESQHVFLVNQMIEMLLNIGAARKQRLHPKQIGIHPSNRDGLGIVDENVHLIGKDIDSDGFIFAAVDPICFEDDDAKSSAKFTI